MEEKLKKIYKKLSEQASKNGFYMIPKEFYAKLFNQIEQLRKDRDTARNSRDLWRSKYKELREEVG